MINEANYIREKEKLKEDEEEEEGSVSNFKKPFNPHSTKPCNPHWLTTHLHVYGNEMVNMSIVKYCTYMYGTEI